MFVSALAISVIIVHSMLIRETIGEPTFEDATDFLLGIDVAYADLDQIKELIEEVSPYTNFFLVGTTGISRSAEKLDEICQLLYDRDMSFVVYAESPRHLWLIKEAQEKWGDRFLGLEYEDEMGGTQLDVGEIRVFEEAEDAPDAAEKFIDGIGGYLNYKLPLNPAPVDFPLFTADYALYWFDYKAGYDVVLAEFGWNYSRQLNVALCRGAATVLNKEWGVMITWTYTDPPYIESGVELYQDLVLAYENGAKYILVFDTNENYTKGILQEEHLEALREFWNYINNNPRDSDFLSDRVAFVLPSGFGYGFRGPDDKIWGQWESDVFSLEISYHLGYWLEEYETKLDIIYDDELELNNNYSKYIFWNGTTYIP